jgi:arsenite/tail-anchored protein-transporting ATPase
MKPPSPCFLDQRELQLLVFGGKGGVGKTTCATASALQLALHSPGRRILLVSTDPAHSLLDSLGGMALPVNLTALELNPEECLEAFRATHSHPLREIAAAGTFLDDEDIRQFLDLSLPGLDELMAFLEIAGWVERREYDCIAVDTAPSGHALRLLAIPRLLAKWLCMLEALLAKRRYMRRVFARSDQGDPLDLYLEDWNQRLTRTEQLLRDPLRTQFVPVTIAESLSAHETADLMRELRRRKVPAPEVIVNQIHPANGCGYCCALRAREWRVVQELRAVPGLTRASLWGVDLFPQEVRGPNLLGFWTRAWPFDQAPPARAAIFPAGLDEVDSPAPHFASAVKLLIFAGKGGVGKTTLACATALRQAEERPYQKILLFSTDPAHSTTACLGIPIGPAPIAILPNLSAVEIDSAAEFAELKSQYVHDVEAFLEAITHGFDLTFDRTVLERLMDLAPPGLDEVMALTKTIQFMERGSYDLFVIDSAATGHLVRLLEMPDLINDWLKAFFSFFLKYQNIIEWPSFSARLVELSKSLKRFRKLLTDRQRALLCAVSIPTRMAFEESRDLMASCARMGIATPTLFLNLMTPPGSYCSLCTELRKHELLVADDFARAFPHAVQTRVYRREYAVGREALVRLGQALYRQRAFHRDRPFYRDREMPVHAL